MARLYVSEYAGFLLINGQAIVMSEEPAIRNQVVQIDAGSNASEPFNARTRLVRLHADETCSIKFGKGATATPDDARLAADRSELFAVHPGDQVAVFLND